MRRCRRALLILLLVMAAPAFAGKLGPEIQLNTTTSGWQNEAAAAQIGDGGFVAFYKSASTENGEGAIFGRRFTASGAPAGAEFQVNRQGTRSSRPLTARLK